MNTKRLLGPALLVVIAFGISLLSPAAVEAFAGMLPAVTTLLALVFAITVFGRFRHNGRRYLLLWGIGISLYALGTAMEAAFGWLGWQPLIFRAYYLSGALLTAAWLGQGTIQLLGRRWLPPVALALLSLGSLVALYEVSRADLDPVFMSDQIAQSASLAATPNDPQLQRIAEAVSTPGGAFMDPWQRAIAKLGNIDPKQVTIAPERLGYGVRKDRIVVGTRKLMDQLGIDVTAISTAVNSNTPIYVAENGQVRGAFFFKPPLELNGAAIVRTTSNARSITPFFNVYGTLALAGGAIYSAFLFWRKRVLYNRMLGNILIATGALAPALGGTLSKAGFPTALYISELVGIVLIFIGYTQAVKTGAPEPVPARRPATA